ncbi:tRNA-queuosine alpha-mannosyltransferase domain-containing protein [Thalassomonas actiniarum]|uniref:tRNA-queuosine alpha-mannosyltransferase n=1 Tax=Thalassomonas actiniarum TaxID=485447 RepID=A0AAF0C1V3_9GAMM|nr:DUF3524 domain-containing protein [Thalassomonas actiniarum]WDD97837.1 DUF3524 domain-containing protein [Thalassomonas actiniarum]
MRILLLSAYDAVSHQYWRKGLVEQFPEYDWTVLTLPGRFFSWRVRGNSLSWAFSERKCLEQPYDLLIATSMTDLSALKGLVPSLAGVPSIVYFHENQFAYPLSGKEFSSVEPKVLSLYSALAADFVVFNTRYNKETFFNGADALLKKLPDQVPPGLIELLASKTRILPVPVLDTALTKGESQSGPLQVIWNHRWEYDKGPELLYRVMLALKQQNVRVRFHLVGQQFRDIPPVFEQLKKDCCALIATWGHVDSRREYNDLLQNSDVVLSTALHDFQGIAVLEGVAAGCVPVVPDRLAYPELFSGEFCYSDQGNEAANLAEHLAGLAGLKAQQALPRAPSVGQFCWSEQQGAYRQLLTSAAGSR